MKPKPPEPIVPPNIEQLVPYIPGKPIEEVERELGIAGAYKLASNENPVGPSPRALEAVRRALSELHRYPDGSASALRSALATRHGVTVDEIVVGNGSAELIELLVRTFCAPGSEDEVLTGRPSFAIYELEAQAHGVRHVGVPLDAELRYDVSGLLAAASARTKICFIANPNNPTGTYMPAPDLSRLARELPEHVILAVDEAYFEYATAPDYPDSLALRGLRERLLGLRTFSKAYGLAGLRVGYMVGPPKLAQYVQRVRPAFNVNSLAQVAALAAMRDDDQVARSRGVTSEGLAFLKRELGQLGIKVWPTQANFVFVDVGRDARAVYQALLQRGVIVRPIGGPHNLRITAGLPAENERLLRALKEVLSA
ncbi:MAG TPA: histidinol-phosphate transaminase [Polyangia bacterium]|nr:histidinol-phosphate transaminase [Polyangia bacterium]